MSCAQNARVASCFCDTVTKNAQACHTAGSHRGLHCLAAGARVPGRRFARSLDRRAHGSPGAVCRPRARASLDGARSAWRHGSARGSDGIPRSECAVEREDYAVIHPFSGSTRKNWPLEKFRGLAKKLERVMPVRWCTGEDDPPLPGAVRIDDLYELACWLAKARVFIGNDSGITHLAAAVGTPVLALFGPTDPEVWAPRGPHVRVGRWGIT